MSRPVNNSMGHEKALSALAKVRYCPITGNQPTTVSSIDTAKKLCSYRRSIVLDKQQTSWCTSCRGRHLTEYVTIKPLAEMQAEEDPMAKNNDTFTKCDSCGSEKSCRTVHGKKLCMACQPIYAAAKSAPGILLAALEAQGTMPTVPEGGLSGKSKYEADIEATAQFLRDELDGAKKELVLAKTENDRLSVINKDLQDDIAGANAVIAYKNQEIVRYQQQVNEKAEALDGQAEAYEHQLAALRPKIHQMEGMLLASTAEVNRLRAIEDAYLHDRQVDGKQIGQGRDAALLDVALDVLARVSGDAHRHILALREVA